MLKSTLLITLVVALLAGTAAANPGPPELPPADPRAWFVYDNNAGTVQLVTRGQHYEVAKKCQGLQGDQGVVYAEVLTWYYSGHRTQAYHLQLYPDWGCEEKDPVTGEYRASVRLQTYAGNGEPMRDSDGKVFVPKSFKFVPAYRF